MEPAELLYKPVVVGKSASAGGGFTGPEAPDGLIPGCAVFWT